MNNEYQANVHEMPQDSDGGPDFHFYVNVLLRRWKLALVIALVVVVGTVVKTFMTVPIYQSSAVLQVKKKQENNLLKEMGMKEDTSLTSDMQILYSYSMAESVAHYLNLDWVVAEEPSGLSLHIRSISNDSSISSLVVKTTGSGVYKLFDTEGNLLGQGHSGELLDLGKLKLLIDIKGSGEGSFLLKKGSLYQVATRIKNNIRASEGSRGTNILRLEYQDNDPERARDVVSGYIAMYQQQNIDSKTEEARQAVEFIEKQLNDLKFTLDKTEQDLQEFKVESGLVTLGPEGDNLVSQLVSLEQQQANLSLERKRLVYAIDDVTTALAKDRSCNPLVIERISQSKDLAGRLATLEAERKTLLESLTKAHPSVISVRQKIREVQEALLAAYRSGLKSIDLEHADLNEKIAGYKKQIKDVPQVELELAKRTRVNAVNSELYTFLLQKLQEARISTASSVSNIEIIDPPVLPVRPIKPNKTKNFLLGILLGCMAGIGVAFFLEYLDDSIKDGETAKRQLGLPLLSVIPYIGFDRNGKDAQALGAGNSSRRVLIAQFKPKSAAAEAFRSLRTALHFSSLGKEKKVLLVTSAFPSEGKTTISGNLAVTLAQTGNRVLLVGCDLRKPTLQEMFGDKNAIGLTEVLVGDAKVDDAIKPTGLFQLDFLPSGAVPPNPAELLESERMKKLVQALRDRYDVILLDAPPVLAVTDASILTSLAEQVVWVLHVGGVSIKAARRVKEIMDSIKAPLVGFVLNDKTQTGQGYYGSYGRYGTYGRYGYGYGYGYGYYQQDQVVEKPGIVKKLVGRLTDKG
jgi:tyrosine-protein kinase Etk/Wzc